MVMSVITVSPTQTLLGRMSFGISMTFTKKGNDPSLDSCGTTLFLRYNLTALSYISIFHHGSRHLITSNFGLANMIIKIGISFYPWMELHDHTFLWFTGLWLK